MSCNCIPRPEFPNPQFEREDWVNLNGEWEFEIDNGKSGRDRKLFEAEGLSGKITVPYCPQSELSGINCKDFMYAVWYRKEIDIPAEKLNGRVMLHFGAVDYEAYVYVNGKLAGTHRGGYVPFCIEITDLVSAGKNVITLCAEDDERSPLIPVGKQCHEYNSCGCHYTRTTGIWQTVWLEFIPKNYVKNFKVYTDCDSDIVDLRVNVCGKGTVKAEAYFEGKKVGEAQSEANHGNAALSIKLSEKHLWDVGKGNLYDLTITFGDDKVKSYFGIRSVCLDGDKFILNNRCVFMRLVLDQGFYPDGIYTAKTAEDLKKDIELSLAVGFNGARLHEKVFEPLFLYYCDKAGYIVWGEYPNWGIDYSDPKCVPAVLSEWCEAVERDFNHPAIIGWCPFNETWDYGGRRQWNELLRTVYTQTKILDTTRPCIDTSGNYHVITDIYDVHDYEQNPAIFKESYDKLVNENVLFDKVSNNGNRQSWKGEPVFVSEYGGIRWADESAAGWGYGNAPKSEEEFLERYKGLTDALLDNERMCGFCYTQLYDVEQELNGLYTYYRQPKFDTEYFKGVNSRKAAIED